MANGLHDFYIPGDTEHGQIEDSLKKYDALVNENRNFIW